jgi:hypothetical protein
MQHVQLMRWGFESFDRAHPSKYPLPKKPEMQVHLLRLIGPIEALSLAAHIV